MFGWIGEFAPKVFIFIFLFFLLVDKNVSVTELRSKTDVAEAPTGLLAVFALDKYLTGEKIA